MKEFEVPEIWVCTFAVEDIITSSSGASGSEEDSGAIGGGAWEDELPR